VGSTREAGWGAVGGDVADRSSFHHGPPRTGSRRAATSYRLIAHPRCSLILTTGKSVPRPVCPYLIISERGHGHGDIPNQVFILNNNNNNNTNTNILILISGFFNFNDYAIFWRLNGGNLELKNRSF
jgi:hypothetical protein